MRCPSCYGPFLTSSGKRQAPGNVPDSVRRANIEQDGDHSNARLRKLAVAGESDPGRIRVRVASRSNALEDNAQSSWFREAQVEAENMFYRARQPQPQNASEARCCEKERSI